MKCNLQCPYSKPNGVNTEGNQSIICESRKWFMTDLDDCIEGYDEKAIHDLRNIFGIKTTPGEKFRVFTELLTNEKFIVNMIIDEPLTFEDACNLLNKQDNEIEQLKNNLSEIEKIINNRLDPKVVPKFSDGKTELFIEEKVGYFYALEQLKKKLIREDLLFKNEKED